jgi:FkbM family methyltransferase
LIRLLDRPGGRLLLGKIATRVARKATGDDVEIEYVGGFWTHRIGPYLFPDSLGFDYTPSHFEGWKGDLGQYTRYFWFQHYQPQEGDVIIDVGAGRGEDTLTFSRAVGETGRVIAIEAHPLSFKILERFCRSNELKNVTLLEVALMDQPGTVQIVGSDSSWMESAIARDEGSRGIPVRATTLNEVFRQQGLKDVALLKMNIEGAERYALLGMEQAVRSIRQICVACHDFRFDRGEGEMFRTRYLVEQFLIEHGFTLASRPNDPCDAVRDHVYGLRPAQL